MGTKHTNQGKVKFFNETKGFGFITDIEDPKEETFVHATQCKDKIKEGDTVNFNIGPGNKGPQATDVSLA